MISNIDYEGHNDRMEDDEIMTLNRDDHVLPLSDERDDDMESSLSDSEESNKKDNDNSSKVNHNDEFNEDEFQQNINPYGTFATPIMNFGLNSPTTTSRKVGGVIVAPPPVNNVVVAPPPNPKPKHNPPGVVRLPSSNNPIDNISTKSKIPPTSSSSTNFPNSPSNTFKELEDSLEFQRPLVLSPLPEVDMAYINDNKSTMTTKQENITKDNNTTTTIGNNVKKLSPSASTTTSSTTNNNNTNNNGVSSVSTTVDKKQQIETSTKISPETTTISPEKKKPNVVEESVKPTEPPPQHPSVSMKEVIYKRSIEKEEEKKESKSSKKDQETSDDEKKPTPKKKQPIKGVKPRKGDKDKKEKEEKEKKKEDTKAKKSPRKTKPEKKSSTKEKETKEKETKEAKEKEKEKTKETKETTKPKETKETTTKSRKDKSSSSSKDTTTTKKEVEEEIKPKEIIPPKKEEEKKPSSPKRTYSDYTPSSNSTTNNNTSNGEPERKKSTPVQLKEKSELKKKLAKTLKHKGDSLFKSNDNDKKKEAVSCYIRAGIHFCEAALYSKEADTTPHQKETVMLLNQTASYIKQIAEMALKCGEYVKSGLCYLLLQVVTKVLCQMRAKVWNTLRRDCLKTIRPKSGEIGYMGSATISPPNGISPGGNGISTPSPIHMTPNSSSVNTSVIEKFCTEVENFFTLNEAEENTNRHLPSKYNDNAELIMRVHKADLKYIIEFIDKELCLLDS